MKLTRQDKELARKGGFASAKPNPLYPEYQKGERPNSSRAPGRKPCHYGTAYPFDPESLIPQQDEWETYREYAQRLAQHCQETSKLPNLSAKTIHSRLSRIGNGTLKREAWPLWRLISEPRRGWSQQEKHLLLFYRDTLGWKYREIAEKLHKNTHQTWGQYMHLVQQAQKELQP